MVLFFCRRDLDRLDCAVAVVFELDHAHATFKGAGACNMVEEVPLFLEHHYGAMYVARVVVEDDAFVVKGAHRTFRNAVFQKICDHVAAV